MPEVFIDGEKIEFSGAPPEDLESLLAVVSSALGGAGRVVAGVDVAGRGQVHELSDEEYAAAHRIDLTSMSVVEALAQVAAENAAHIATAVTDADRLASEVLWIGWLDIQGRCAKLGSQLARVAEGLGSLLTADQTGLGLSRAMEAYLPALELWMDAVQAGDAAAVCLRLDHEVLPALKQVEQVVRKIAREGGA